MAENRNTRRQFVGMLAALGAPQTSTSPKRLPIYDLDLPPEVLTDLEAFAQDVIREARWLDELPLENVDPDFTFVPR